MRGEHGANEDPARRGKWPERGGWRCRAALVVGLAALGHGTTPAVATADRVALVIGNSAYEHTSELPNPVNDATAMRDALTRLGFDVVFRRDADEDAMEDALGAFEEMSAGADLALVFYAGHGLEMNGGNYLVPVDARLSSAAAVGRETVALDDVLNAVAEARTRIVILDACRNNPFARSMRGAVRANVRSGGLAAVAAGAGSLVAYAAAAGDVADDGTGRYSPFTEALLAQIEQPGVEVRIMLGNVGEAVRARTGRQQPFVYSSLSGEHYLGNVSVGANPAAVEAALGLDESARRAVQRRLMSAGFAAGVPDGVFGPMTRAAIRAWQRSRGGTPSGYLDAASATALGARVGSSPAAAAALASVAPAAPSTTSAGTAAAAALQQETVFWESIRASTDPADFEAYLALFANGTFAPLARNRLAALRGAAGARPAADPPRAGVRDGDLFRDCPSCPELVVIPAGEFLMGSPAAEEGRDDDEGPQRRVRVERFALGLYEVTRAEYAAFARSTGRDGNGCRVVNDDGRWERSDRALWRSPGFPQSDEHPAACVSWDDARAYVRWLSRETGLSYRLPSEAEWEYAARGGTTTSRYWGDRRSEQCSNANGADAAGKQRFENWRGVASCNDGRVFTAPVGTFRENRFGLFDMPGNVREWVEDCWHNSYRGAPTDGSAWTGGGECGRRVLRGGSWGLTPAGLRSAYRDWATAGYLRADVGLRVARALD